MKSFIVFGLLLAFLFVGCLSEPQLTMPTPSPSPVPSYTYHEPSPTPSVQATAQASTAPSRAPSPTPSFKLKIDSVSSQYNGDAFKVFITNNVGEKIKFYSLTVNGSGNLAVEKSLEAGAQNSLITTDLPSCGESGASYTAKVKFEYQKVPGAEVFSETQYVNGYCT